MNQIITIIMWVVTSIIAPIIGYQVKVISDLKRELQDQKITTARYDEEKKAFHARLEKLESVDSSKYFAEIFTELKNIKMLIEKISK